jgi:hypothetical protein
MPAVIVRSLLCHLYYTIFIVLSSLCYLHCAIFISRRYMSWVVSPLVVRALLCSLSAALKDSVIIKVVSDIVACKIGFVPFRLKVF